MMVPILPPVIMVPRSAATVGIDTFITERSSVIRNWLLASTARTSPAPADFAAAVGAGEVTGRSSQTRHRASAPDKGDVAVDDSGRTSGHHNVRDSERPGPPVGRPGLS